MLYKAARYRQRRSISPSSSSSPPSTAQITLKILKMLLKLCSGLLMLACVASTMSLKGAEAMPGQHGKTGNGGDLGSALQYLQDLDNYYPAAGRARTDRARRDDDDVASALMKLSQIKQHYSNVGRPRFGKRASWFPGSYLDADYPVMSSMAQEWDRQ